LPIPDIYTLTVPYPTTGITLSAFAHESHATVTGAGAKTLNVGENTFTISVVAEDATTTQTYTVKITRIAPETDASLSSLETSAGELDFNAAASQFNVYVANRVSGLSIQATAASATATVTGTGAKTLNEGENNFEIVVTAQDGVTTQTCTVVIFRADAIVQDDLVTQLQAYITILQADSTQKANTILELNNKISALQAEVAILQAELIECMESKGSSTHTVETVLEVYPNPTTGVVHINNSNGAEVKVYNLDGEWLQITRESRIDLSGYPTGVYLLQVGMEILKVVKK
jgi:hypothetical protein